MWCSESPCCNTLPCLFGYCIFTVFFNVFVSVLLYLIKIVFFMLFSGFIVIFYCIIILSLLLLLWVFFASNKHHHSYQIVQEYSILKVILFEQDVPSSCKSADIWIAVKKCHITWCSLYYHAKVYHHFYSKFYSCFYLLLMSFWVRFYACIFEFLI